MKKIYKYIFVLVAILAAVPATAQSGDKGDKSNVKLFKTTVPTGNEDEYLITLNSFVTGTSIVSDVVNPVDLMLILDVSTSMSASQKNQGPYNGYYILGEHQKLFSADNLSKLHKSTTSHNNYNQTITGHGSRYQIKLNGQNTLRDMQLANGKWQYYNGSKWVDYTTGDKKDTIYTDVKIDLLQEATRVFIDEIYKSSLGADGIAGTDDDIPHRIGFATFCGSLTQSKDLQSVLDGYSGMISFVDDLHNHMGGNTAPSTAFDKAVEYYNGRTTGKDHSIVSVMFTDGEPTEALNTSIKSSYKLKQLKDSNGKNAKVFTVGIFEDATKNIGTSTVSINAYMEYMSSDYPNAQATGNTGKRNTDGIEYYKLSDGSNLSAIFLSIAQTASADTYKLTESDAAAVDVMSDDFELPAGFEEGDVTLKQFVCTGVGDGIGGFTWVEYKKVSTDKISDDDNPKVFAIDKTNQRLTVNGFSYALDDVTHTDSNGKIVVDTYGNFVGKHADGQYAGKMLQISFKVNLKSSSMGGYGLPSNKISSGIYQNTGTPANPSYTYNENSRVAAYPLPVVDVPSIIIIKEGLKFGDSAIFTVSGNGLNYTIMLSQTDPKGEAMCYMVIKDLEAGDYTVKEDAGWSWTYTPDTHFATEQTFNLHHPDYGDTDAAGFKASLLKDNKQNASLYGQTHDDAGNKVSDRTKEENMYYVMNDALHLMFKFKNADSGSKVLHDEAFTVNVFGANGGSAEFGGVDPEVEL